MKSSINHPYIGECIKNDDNELCYFIDTWSDENVNFLANHRVGPVSLLPGVCYVEMFRALLDTIKVTCFSIKNIRFEKILYLDQSVKNKNIYTKWNKKSHEASIYSIDKTTNDTIVHMTCEIYLYDDTEANKNHNIDESKNKWTKITEMCSMSDKNGTTIPCGDVFYKTIGNNYTNEFKSLDRIHPINEKGTEVVGVVKMDKSLNTPYYLRNCAAMDVSTHTFMAMGSVEDRKKSGYVEHIDEIVIHPIKYNTISTFYVHALLEDSSKFYFYIYDDEGTIMTEIIRLKSGTFEERNSKLIHTNDTVFVDNWENIDVAEVMNTDNFIRIENCFDVKQLHKKLDYKERPDTLITIPKESDVSGFIRTLRTEYPLWNIYVVYTLNPLLIKDIPKNNDFEFQYIDNKWYVRRIVGVKNDLIKKNFSDDGYYIITGGLGYIGKLSAEMLFKNGVSQENIVLVSSSKNTLPDDWSWDFYPTVQKCDVSNENQMENLFHKYDKINGVIHTAGILADKTIVNMTEEDFDKVYQPKVQGAINIDKIMQKKTGSHKPWVVLCSSIAAGFGSMAQANYSAANASLDALARDRGIESGGKGGNYVSIRWGAWIGGGMALDETLERTERIGLLGLQSNVGIDIMHGLISSPLKNNNVVTVCPINYEKIKSVGGYTDKIASKVEVMETEDYVKKLKLIVDTTERKKIIAEKLIENSSTLGIDDMEYELPWREAGFDSLSMVEMVNLLRSQFHGITFSDTVLFDYPNIKMLSEYISNNVVNLKRQVDRKKIKRAEPIAIVGMACHFPKDCDNPLKLYDFLMQGGDAMEEIPKERFDVTEYPDIYVKKGSFVHDFEYFDNETFGISETEAARMDPQQRLMLENAKETLDQVNNIDKEKCGVYIAVFTNDFAQIQKNQSVSSYDVTGAGYSIVPNRVSYTFGLKGPSMNIETACSSSLVAIDTACRAIETGACTQALVGAVQLNLAPGLFIACCGAKMLSPRGRCATFSDEADGYARGEGLATIFLKKCSDAVRDGDKIYAVIHGSAVNQDGRSANLTSPNGPSQESVIEEAIGRAGLTIDDIDLIEAHGTGTPLGDPQEIQSIGNVFHERIPRPLYIGAVKANFGHMEGVAGMLSVIKTIIVLQKQQLPPNINCDKINPRIVPVLDNNPCIKFPRQGPVDFNEPDKKSYYAGCSGFGIGGTNAHVIIGFHK